MLLVLTGVGSLYLPLSFMDELLYDSILAFFISFYSSSFLKRSPGLNLAPPSASVNNMLRWFVKIVAFVSASYVRNMHDGKTCVEAGYKDITSLSQCESAFRFVPEHREKTNSMVCYRDCSSFVIPAFVNGCFCLFCFWPLLSCAVFPFAQFDKVKSSRSDGGCLSGCFSEYDSYYFCRYWGSNAVQSKTDKSEDQYMLCVLPRTTTATTTTTAATEGSIMGHATRNY